MYKFITFLAAVVGFGLLYFLIYFGIARPLSKSLNEYQTEMKSHLGDTVVLNKDTCIITDYSMFDDSYTLSNGSTVNIDLIEILKTNK